MYVLVLENSAQVHRCETCGPTYSGEQLARVSQFFIRRDVGLPVEVRYADLADPEQANAYAALLSTAHTEAWTFPVVLLVEDDAYRVLLQGRAEPFAIVEALKAQTD